MRRANGGAWRQACAKARAWRPILTAEQMRAAEQGAGCSVEELMERAGAALAEAIYRFAGPLPALVLCGPGNNGGDGYVAARYLAERGVDVRVAGVAEPGSDAGKWARGQWNREVEKLSDQTAASGILIDCLFGTGLKRGLEEPMLEQFLRLCRQSQVRIACDLPSGVDSNSGAELSEIPAFNLTVTFGALKPAHRLHPAMHKCGRVALADIGISASDEWHEIGPPALPPLAPDANKYSRGLVHALAGKMPGAIALAATAAARTGAGYVRVSTSRDIHNLPASVAQVDTAEVNDPRIGCLLVGPGMGDIPQVLTLALTSKAPKVIDADAHQPFGRARAAEGPGRDHHAARGRIPAAVRKDRGIQAGPRAGGRAAQWRGGGLQGAGHARGIARWTAGLCAAGAGMAWPRRGPATSCPG